MRHSQRALALAFLAFTGFASSPAFGNVLTVAPTGATYTQIQTAVSAAASDDVILISPGSYGGVTIDGKSVTLCSKVAGTVTMVGTSTVKNLTASQRVVLSGLKGYGVDTQQGIPDEGVGLLVVNNAGYVRLESCNFYGAIGLLDNSYPPGTGVNCILCATPASCCSLPPESMGRHGAVVRNNPQGVAFTACRIEGGRGAHANNFGFCECGQSWPGGDGLQMQAAVVSLYDCNVIGGAGGNNADHGGAGGMGCRLTPGTGLTGVFASGSRFEGGRGGNAFHWLCGLYPGKGGTALQVNPSTSAYLLGNTYVVGQPGVGDWGTNTPGATIAGGGSVFQDPESRLLMTAERIARAGSSVDVRIEGTPGQVIHLIVSRTPTFQIIASWRGARLALPGKGSVDVLVGAIPANGVLQTRYLVPPLPAGVTSSTVFVQAYRFDAVLGPKLAASTCITLVQ